MTILSETMKIIHIGDGVEVDYSYDFMIPSSSEVIVTVANVATTDFVISGLNNPIGGTVTFNSPPADQAEIIIKRNVELTQNVDYRPYDPFPAETHELALDRIVMMVQQINDAIIRSVQNPEGLLLTIPEPGAGEYIKYADDGESLETSDLVNVAGQVVPVATTSEIVNGIETATRLVSPNQIKIGVNAHETPAIDSVYGVGWLSVVDVLPASPEANKAYFVRIP